MLRYAADKFTFSAAIVTLYYYPRVHKFRAMVTTGIKFCTVAPNTGGSALCNSLYVTLLAPKSLSLRWFLDFGEICESLSLPIVKIDIIVKLKAVTTFGYV